MATVLRLLVLEDESNDADLEIAELEAAGYICKWVRVETREEFLSSLDTSDYDVILSDYSLPDFDGLTALDLVVERKIDIPFIFVSGTLGEELAIESLKSGATDYVLKNRLSRLAPVVKRALKEREDRQKRQRAEAAALHFSHVLEDSLNEIFIFDAETLLFVEVNRGARENIGYSIEELRGMTPLDIKPEITPELFEELIKPLQEGDQEKIQFFTVHRRKDGTEYPVETHLQLMSNNEAVFVAIILDITSRKKAEQSLLESEERMELVLEGASLGSWDWNVPTSEVVFNDRLVGMLGYTLDEFAPELNSWESLIHPDDLLAVQKILKRHLEGSEERFEAEYRMRKKSGDWIWILDKGRVIERAADGSPLRACGTHQDITERRQSEMEKERFMTAIDQVAETIMITDAEGNIQYVNPAFARITGYTREEVIGQNPRLLKSGEQNDAFYQVMWKTLSEGETWNGRLVNRKQDGTFFTEEATISPVKDSEGRIVNYVAIKLDITEGIIRENQYRQTQKMESVGRLAGGIAHDFNNILQTITGFCGLLLVEMDARSDLRKDVIEIQTAVKYAGSLTRQLLAFSREQPSEYKVLDLNAVLFDAKKMFLQALDENIHLQFELASDLRSLNADASQILQIVLNLIVNARDAMENGGRITLSTQNKRVKNGDLRGHPQLQRGEYVCLSVSDSGCGMDHNQLDHLFEPFYTTKQLGKGTGLGLSVVYGIIEEHGGWIEVDSELNKGTSFRVFLPVYNAAGSDDGDKIHYDESVGKRILLVEDDSVVRELTAEILQDVGYAVSVAEDATTAGKLFSEKNGAFDLLFSDVVLPDGNGIELADIFLKQCPELSILLFSGHSDECVKRDIITEKGFNYIRKPFNLKKLLDTVELTITGQRAK